MKKLGLFFLTLLLLVGLCGCNYKDPVLRTLPNYTSESFFTSGGFQDFTDYAKYTYEDISVQTLDSSKYFTAANADDVEEILLHIENFEKWVEAVGGEVRENYDFDKTIVSQGDYFYIKTKAGEPIGGGTYKKFDCYTLYYFDVDTQILYYFHHNI